MKQNTIVSLITPPLMGAIAVIRISGDDALSIAQTIFSRKITNPNTAVFGNIIDGKEVIDQVIITFFKAPHSFTGEDVIEISCHGSMLIAKQIITLIIAKGARLAERGEFSSRAYFNNKIDLVQAEAINSLINANTIESKQLALYSLQGNTSSLLYPLINDLADILSHIEVNIDYPEYQDIEQLTTQEVIDKCQSIRETIESLLSQSKKSQYIVNGIKVALIGLPNTGKSSLLNAFLNQEKAIVTNIPGTTRDIVEGDINLNGLPLHLLDTAGIHDSTNLVEKIGIERSQQTIENADLIIMVVDGSKPLTKEEKDLIKKIKDKTHFIVYNKSDLFDDHSNRICISAKNKDITQLKDAILKQFNISAKDITPSLCSAREYGLLSSSLNNLNKAFEDAKNNISLDLISISIKEAYDNLREIVGQTVNIDLSEEIFSRFCVGK